MAYTFETDCVHSTGTAIGAMVDGAKQISRRTFLRYVDRASLAAVERSIGYDRDFPMSRDWAVSYHRSTYRGRPCVYFAWSAIEHVFVDGGGADPSETYGAWSARKRRATWTSPSS